MELYARLKRSGFSGIIKSLKLLTVGILNKVFFKLFSIKKIDNNLIVLESEGDCCDNAYALFDYMKSNGYLDKYKIVWLVDYPENYIDTEKVKYCYKDIESKFSFNTIVYLSTCKYYIYDHCNVLGYFKKPEQKAIALNHGMVFKASTQKKGYVNPIDESILTSPLFSKGMSQFCACDENKCVVLGFSRCDYFFKPLNNKQERIKKEFAKYNKVILWMPTFRRSKSKTLDEEYFDSKTGLPIIKTDSQLNKLNQLLQDNNLLCIFKIHHLQAELDSFKKEYSNIRVLNDDDFVKMGIQNYQFVMLTDVLITDYSSIAVDYMLLDKPIIYTMDDYEEYKASRGFWYENPKQYFVGYQVYDETELFESLIELGKDVDKYKEERRKLLPTLHTYTDGNASKRILNHLGIKI